MVVEMASLVKICLCYFMCVRRPPLPIRSVSTLGGIHTTAVPRVVARRRPGVHQPSKKDLQRCGARGESTYDLFSLSPSQCGRREASKAAVEMRFANIRRKKEG